MSNTTKVGLNYPKTIKATLTIDCDGHEEKIEIDTWPSEYDEHQQGPQRVGTPTPTLLEFDSGDYGWSQKLITGPEAIDRIRALEQKVYTVLSASVVNEKQRKALVDIVRGYFDETVAPLF